MALGYIDGANSQYVLREYEETGMRVRLLSLFDGDHHAGYRVEKQIGDATTKLHSFESELFGLGQEQFNMALGCFKGYVLPMVDL